MKNLLFILTFSFLFLFSCSSGSDDSEKVDNTLLMRKWYDNSYDCNGVRDYFEFSAPNIFKHFVTPTNNDCSYILAESGIWKREDITITINFDQNIETAILTIDELSATTFSFVSSGGYNGYSVLSSY